MKRFAMAAGAAAVLSGCAGFPGSPTPRSAFGPLEEVKTGETTAQEIRGVWQSRGYGFFFDVTEEGLTLYHAHGGQCLTAPAKAKALSATLSIPYQYYRMGPSPDEAIFQLLPDDTEIRADRIGSLPEACTEEPDTSYAAMLEFAIAALEDEYAFFDLRGIDMDARAEKARAEIAEVDSDEAFFEVLRALIDGFSDSHTKVLAVIDGRLRKAQDGLGETLPRVRAGGGETPWLIDIFTTLIQDSLAGARHVAGDRILWGTIDDRVGYIQILQMGGFSGTEIDDPAFRENEFAVFNEVMDEALAAFEGYDAVILDLSNNRGGYDAISRMLASRFAAEAFDAYSTEVPTSGVPPRMRRIEPHDGLRFEGPVYLLTTDVTVSGGEIATLALRQLPNVEHVGTTTRGSFSTVLAKPLANGFVLELSNEVFRAPDGTAYEETGIAPEREIDVFGPKASHAEVIRQIAAEASAED